MEGYGKIAQLMGSFDEFAIFRRFRSLNYQNILYLQAEILHLEDDLRKLAERDARHAGREFHAKDWWSLSQGDEEEDQEQWDKVLELREALEKYSALPLPTVPREANGTCYADDTLLKTARVASLDHPAPYNLNLLRLWFQRPSMGAFPLRGLDQTAWDAEHESDLLAMSAHNASDSFSRWFNHRLVPWAHALLGEKIKVGR
jgi:hypothetical protein